MYGFTQFCMFLCNWLVHMGFVMKSLGHELSPWLFPVHSAKWEDGMLIRLRLLLLSFKPSPFRHSPTMCRLCYMVWYLSQNAVYFITFFFGLSNMFFINHALKFKYPRHKCMNV